MYKGRPGRSAVVNVVANKRANIGNNRCNYGLILSKSCGTIDYGNKRVTVTPDVTQD